MFIKSHYKVLTLGIMFILLFTQMATAVSSISNNIVSFKNSDFHAGSYLELLALEIWVDDDYYDGGYNNGHTWGYDAFDNIQDGIDNADDGGIIHVKAGLYPVFYVMDRSDLLIEGYDGAVPLVRGFQLVWDVLAAQIIKVISFVNNSDDIIINGVEFQGTDLTGRSVGVFYQKSSGQIIDCIVSPNQKGNMYNLAIRAHINSVVTIKNCTIENYGRIGIYCRQGTTLIIEDNTIIGQIYSDSDGDFVSYGIEIEALPTTSHAQIRYNNIYHHNHVGNPTWSSAAIIIDSWRYYQEAVENCTATIEFNNIHDNMLGVQIVPNDYIHFNNNIINGNTDFGAVSDPYIAGTSYVYHDLDARYNWWGDASGPYEASSNPDGLGDGVTDFVIYNPWAKSINPIPYFVKPEEGFLYFNIAEIIEIKIPFFMTLIIGKSNIEINAPRCLYGIDYVEFYVDDDLKTTDNTVPYSWVWDEKTLFNSYFVEAKVYDTQGNSGSVRMKSWKIQMRTN